MVFKCENVQRIGAFKFRGAYNALSRLDDAQREAGVITFSSGNHAQAVAASSALLNTKAVIVMPNNAPKIKLTATRDLLAKAAVGSEIITYDPETTSREELGRELAESRGLTLIAPHDHPHVIAGQGTVGMELFEDAGPFDLLLVPVGGGGLISGCAITARAIGSGCRVIGVEPELGDDATRSFRSGKLESVHNPQTIADGARTSSLGSYTFPLLLANVDDMMTVSDPELAAAMRLAMERLKVVIEPTGALAIAGLLKLARENAEALENKRVGVIISGGNVDLDRLSEILALAPKND